MINQKIAKRKTQIIEVAKDLFCEKGYAGTSMRDLSRAVGIEPASLYSHIRSKEELLELICFGLINKFYQSTDLISPSALPASQTLRELINSHIRVVQENRNASAVLLNDWKFLQEKERNRFHSLLLNYEWKFLEQIKRGQENENFCQTDPRQLVKFFLSAINALHSWYRPKPGDDAKQFAAELTQVILRGIIPG